LNPENGVAECSAAASLEDVLRETVPKGWVLPVVPGASGITIGGAIAADAHGKNHFQKGSIAEHLLQISLITPSGTVITASRETNSDVFWATVGGLGLTGIIVEASIALERISSIRIRQSQRRFSTVGEMLEIVESEKKSCEFLLGTVRGDFGPGHSWEGSVVIADHVDNGDQAEIHAYPRRGHVTVPAFFAALPISGLSTWALNRAIRARIRYFSGKEVDLDRFFFPQDALGSWNRLFGSTGFIDYQCCIPIDNAPDFLNDLHKLLNNNSMKCFLVAIKRFKGSENLNPLTFALDGISVAFDMPIRSNTLANLGELDRLAIQCGGRVNLIKDARLPRANFLQMYPRVNEWLKIKRQLDPNDSIRSKLSTRLGLTEL